MDLQVITKTRRVRGNLVRKGESASLRVVMTVSYLYFAELGNNRQICKKSCNIRNIIKGLESNL